MLLNASKRKGYNSELLRENQQRRGTGEGGWKLQALLQIRVMLFQVVSF